MTDRIQKWDTVLTIWGLDNWAQTIETVLVHPKKWLTNTKIYSTYTSLSLYSVFLSLLKCRVF